MNELFVAFLVKTLNITAEEVADLLYKKGEDGKVTEELNEDALQKVLDKDVDRVTSIKSSINTKEYFDNGYKKAQKEVLSELESTIRTEYGIESQSTGIDLVKEIVSKSGKGSTGDLTDEAVKKHPLYLQIEASKQSAIDELKNEYEGKITDINTQYKKGQVFSAIKRDARSILAGFNPIVSENKVVANNRELDFLNKLEKYDYQTAEDGNHLVLDKETGNRIEDPHGNPIKFTDVIKGTAELYYDFAKQGLKGSAGNEDDKGAGSHKNIAVPKTEDEYYEQVSLASDATERAAITEVWEASQK